MRLPSLNWTVGRKIGAAYSLLMAMILVGGAVGFNAVLQLSQSLDYLGGPAWQGAEFAHQTERAAADQLSAVDALLLHGEADAIAGRVAAAETQSRAAIDGLQRLDVVPAEIFSQLVDAQNNYARSRDDLIALTLAYREVNAGLSDNYERFKRFLIELDDLSFASPDIGRRALEIRVALQARFYYFSRIADGLDSRVLTVELRQGEREIRRGIRKLERDEVFASHRLGDGGEPAELGPKITALFEEHTGLMESAVTHLAELKQSHADYGVAAATLGEAVSRIAEAQNSGIASLRQRMAETRDTAQQTIMVAVLISVLTGLAACWMTVRTVVRPIRSVTRRLREFAAGGGNLAAEIEVRGHDEIAELASNFNGFVAKLRETMREVRSATEQLVAESRGLLDSSQATREGLERQNAETSQVATAIGEMSTSASDVARHAETAAFQADNVNSSVRVGRQSIVDNRDAVQKMAAEIASAVDTVEHLDQDAQNIGGILAVIREVAEQTNMLALNAAIEAARAGDHGRGFAVVAEEVRNLAQRTQRATEDVHARISALQKTACSAVEAMRSGQHSVDISVEQATQADAALSEIAAAVDEILRSNQEIASGAEEQSMVASEISRSVSAIAEVSTATRQIADGNATAASTLDQLTERLQGLVSRFKT